ncbi:MAG: 50S ribosomal protein L11 methyltransferase [Burkholderiales bacterium]
MSWLAITLTVANAAADPLADALLAAGAVSVDVSDAHAGTPEERAIFGEPGVDPDGEWRAARVAALFPDGTDALALTAAALADCAVTAASSPVCARVDDQDWVRLTQSQFTPVCITPRLWVVPTWHTPPDPAAVNLIIDPGLAFGTGTHPTTRLCLQWLARTLSGGETVLDYGCGSGILAIAAMKLGAGSATGIDIDPQALVAARGNALQNRVLVSFAGADQPPPAPAAVVIANILANPLKMLAPLLAALTAPGGRLALAGVLAPQAAEVTAAYAGAFAFDAPVAQDEWVLLTGQRHAHA